MEERVEIGVNKVIKTNNDHGFEGGMVSFDLGWCRQADFDRAIKALADRKIRQSLNLQYFWQTLNQFSDKACYVIPLFNYTCVRSRQLMRSLPANPCSSPTCPQAIILGTTRVRPRWATSRFSKQSSWHCHNMQSVKRNTPSATVLLSVPPWSPFSWGIGPRSLRSLDLLVQMAV